MCLKSLLDSTHSAVHRQHVSWYIGWMALDVGLSVVVVQNYSETPHAWEEPITPFFDGAGVSD